MSRGRHRKPTNTGRNLAAISASGAFAIPAVMVGTAEAAEPAQAASSSVWDIIADCESDNRNVNNSSYPKSTASGFFQIVNGTWLGNGGGQFASRAIGASRAEQLIVAQRIAARRGSLADWNASEDCWGDRIGSAVPSAAAASQAQARSAPRAAPTRAAKTAPQGKAARSSGRAADGTGSYVCDTAKLYFDACDPGTLGDTVAYPRYSGRSQAVPAAAVAQAATAGNSASIIADTARNYLGVPYRWGGTTRAGMDCSGLTYTVLRGLGHNPPRTAAAQARWATPVTAAQARPGDLVFHYSPVSHVGIYLGDGRMIDASQPGTSIAVHNVYPGPTRYGRVPS